MDDVSIHAAALKAIEWFKLDPEAMSANGSEDNSGEAPKERHDTGTGTKKGRPGSGEKRTQHALEIPLGQVGAQPSVSRRTQADA